MVLDTYNGHFALERSPEPSVLLVDHALSQDRKLDSISTVHVDDVTQLCLDFNDSSLSHRACISRVHIGSHHYMLE